VAVLAATLSPAQALTARTLSLSLAGTAGASVGASFSGTLTNTPTVGSNVYLQRESGTSWVIVATTTTTTTAGAYKGAFTTPAAVGTYTFRAYSSPTSTLATAVSASRIMRVRITFNASTLNPPASPTTGATLSGRIYPWKSTFTKPVLQRRVGTTGNFTGLATLTPNSTTGNFTKSLTGLTAGQTTQYRVVLATSGGYAGATSRTLTLRAGNPILKTFVADGLQNVAYSSSASAVDGRPGTWALSAGSLPPGLSLNTTNGAITGRPTNQGSFTFTIGFTDTALRPASRQYTMRIDPVSNPTTLQVSAGLAHTCRVNVDKTLQCWGSDFKGQLGIANPDPLTNPRRLVPTDVQGTTWVEVSAGHEYHSCGIKEDYSLWCWGYNLFGQLGLGESGQYNFPKPVQSGTHWRHVSAGSSHTCGIRTDGSLWCWGQGYGNAPVQVGSETVWDQLDAGGTSTCALKTDQKLFCWGPLNSRGWLGTDDTTERILPTEVFNAGTWLSVSASQGHTCGIQVGGTLWCWGRNDNGALGDGTTTDSLRPKQEITGAATWTSVSTHGNGNENHTCATRSDGTLWCWGSGTNGELGGAAVPSAVNPTQVGSETDWGLASSGGNHSCAVKTASTTYCWGGNNDGQIGQGNQTTPQINPKLVN
jgi:alpha-tubulin suppressor-like RCC1 family protein